MEGSASSDRHRRSSIVDRDRGLHQDARTTVMHRDIGNLSSDGGRSSRKWITIKSSSDGRQSMTKNCDRSPIVTPSQCDRRSIVPRLGPPSVWNRFHSIGRRATHDQDQDHGPIAARLWPDRGTFEAKIEANLPQSQELRHRPSESRPRLRKTAPTTASITHEFGSIYLFKNSCSSSLFFNF